MEFSDLQVFHAVVQAGGVVRAAQRLHRAQSSVTARIQVLEDKLGVALFLREKRRMRAEEKAHRLPVLLSIPLVVCMLPVMIGVLMLPAMIRVVRILLPAFGAH